MKKIVVTFGVFDGFHPGHIDFLKQAQKYGEELVVVVARDKTVKKLKDHPSNFSEKERLKIIQKSKLADKVILGGLADPYKIIKKINPDVICLGYDQKYFTENLPEELKKMRLKTKVYTMKPYQPKKYHTSIIKHRAPQSGAKVKMKRSFTAINQAPSPAKRGEGKDEAKLHRHKSSTEPRKAGRR
jgi:FAD synthetase